jgi:hypothetical protein
MSRLLAAVSLALASALASPSFQVANDAFMYDTGGTGAGPQPLVVKSGSLHYHRAHPSTWADRIARLAALGLNTVQTYVPWNVHSQQRGEYDFSGGANLTHFALLVQAQGMLLLLRAGPYICGEHDFGGLPSYLLATPGIASGADLRTNNSAFLAAVSDWWRVLLPLVGPLTVANGGPVAMVQIENEYGSYGNTGGNAADRAYMMALRGMAVALLPAGTQLYTTDGNDDGYLSAGTLPGIVFATGDGSGPPYAADHYNPAGWRACVCAHAHARSTRRRLVSQRRPSAFLLAGTRIRSCTPGGSRTGQRRWQTSAPCPRWAPFRARLQSTGPSIFTWALAARTGRTTVAPTAAARPSSP